jgi:hypothetical protein
VAPTRAFPLDREACADLEIMTVKEMPDIYGLRRGSAFGQETVTSTSRASQQDP